MDHLAEIPKEFALMRLAFFRTEKFSGTSVPGIDGLNGALEDQVSGHDARSQDSQNAEADQCVTLLSKDVPVLNTLLPPSRDVPPTAAVAG